MNEQIDEILVKFWRDVDENTANGRNSLRAKSKAEAKLKRLIVETRIDELGGVGAPNEAYDTICYTDNERGVITVKDRIAQLKKELEKDKQEDK